MYTCILLIQPEDGTEGTDPRHVQWSGMASHVSLLRRVSRESMMSIREACQVLRERETRWEVSFIGYLEGFMDDLTKPPASDLSVLLNDISQSMISLTSCVQTRRI